MSPRARLGILLGLAALGVVATTAPAEAGHAPTFTATTATTGNAPLTVGFSVGFSKVSTWHVEFADGGSTTPVTNSGGTFTHQYGKRGTYVATLFSQRSGGGADVDNSKTVTVTISDTAPVLGAVGNKNAAEGSALSFTVAATDVDADTVAYSATGLPSGATIGASSGVFAWTPSYTQAGTYPVTIVATANGLTDSEGISIVVADVDGPPQFTPVSPRTVAENEILSFTVAATDPEGRPVVLSATSFPSGAEFDAGTGAFSWTPTFTQAGSYTASFSATDGATTPSALDVAITVTNTDRAPTSTLEASATTIREGLSLTFSITVADADGDAVTWSLVPGGGLGALTGTGTATRAYTYENAGSFTATLTATANGLAAPTRTVDVVVEVDDPPLVTLLPVSATGAAPFSTTFTTDASDPDGTVVSWRLDLGDGSTPTTGAGEPPASLPVTYDTAGEYVVELSVTDDGGRTAADTSIVTVTSGSGNTAPAATLNVVEEGSATAPRAVTAHVNVTDADGFTWSLTWGDGTDPVVDSTLETAAVAHTYVSPGSFTVTLTARDTLGAVRSRVATVVVIAAWGPTVTVDGETETAGDAPLTVTFDLSAADTTGVKTRTFSDGRPGESARTLATLDEPITVRYAEPGTYTATLSLSDVFGHVETATATIRVNDLPVADVGVVPSGLVASFTIEADDEDTWDWSLDTGQAGAAPLTGTDATDAVSTSFTYAAAGTYTACVTVTDTDGAVDEDCVTFSVTAPTRSGGGGGGGSRKAVIPIEDPVPAEEPAPEENAARTETGVASFSQGPVVEVRVDGNVTVVQGDLAPSGDALLAFTLEARDGNGTRVRVDGAVVRFAVPRDLVPGDARVVLVHNGTALRTTFLGEDNGTMVFEAATAGFSPFEVVLDGTTPRISDVAPRGIQDAAPTNGTFEVLDDLGIDRVVVTVDGVPVSATVDGNDVRFPVPSTLGDHTVRAEVVDLAGHVARRDWTYSVIDHDALEAAKTDAQERMGPAPVTIAPEPPAPTPKGWDVTDTAFLAATAIEGLVLVGAAARWGPQIAKVVARPRIKHKERALPLADLRCDLCLGAFKVAGQVHACKCGVKLHGSCYVRAGACPGCGSTQGLEIAP